MSFVTKINSLISVTVIIWQPLCQVLVFGNTFPSGNAAPTSYYSGETVKYFDVSDPENKIDVEGIYPQLLDNQLYTLMPTDSNKRGYYSFNIYQTDFSTNSTLKLNKTPISIESDHPQILFSVTCYDDQKEKCYLENTQRFSDKVNHTVISNESFNLDLTDSVFNTLTLSIPRDENSTSFDLTVLFYSNNKWYAVKYKTNGWKADGHLELYLLEIKDDILTLSKSIQYNTTTKYPERGISDVNVISNEERASIQITRSKTTFDSQVNEIETVELNSELSIIENYTLEETVENFGGETNTIISKIPGKSYGLLGSYGYITQSGIQMYLPNLKLIKYEDWVRSPHILETDNKLYVVYFYSEYKENLEGYEIYSVDK